MNAQGWLGGATGANYTARCCQTEERSHEWKSIWNALKIRNLFFLQLIWIRCEIRKKNTSNYGMILFSQIFFFWKVSPFIRVILIFFYWRMVFFIHILFICFSVFFVIQANFFFLPNLDRSTSNHTWREYFFHKLCDDRKPSKINNLLVWYSFFCAILLNHW